MISDGQVLKPN